MGKEGMCMSRKLYIYICIYISRGGREHGIAEEEVWGGFCTWCCAKIRMSERRVFEGKDDLGTVCLPEPRALKNRGKVWENAWKPFDQSFKFRHTGKSTFT